MPDPQQPGSWRKGTAALVVAIAVVLVLLVVSPAYRTFFVISLAIAMIVVGILSFWHKLRPIRPEDVEDKRPLKLR